MDKQNEPINILTFDLEEWFLSYAGSQIPMEKWDQLPRRCEKSTRIFLDLLDEKNLTAVFFVLGWQISRVPDLIAEIADRGHEIGFHSQEHVLPQHQGPNEFEKDLFLGLKELGQLTRREIIYYRAPEFAVCPQTTWVYPVLANHGIRHSSSLRSGRLQMLGVRDDYPFFVDTRYGNVLELPLPRLKLLKTNMTWSGGGYFRLFPYLFINHIMGSRNYNLFYFHPRDFNPQTPRTDLLPFYRNLMNRIGNSTSVTKLRQLMNHHHFMSIGDAVRHLDRSELASYTFSPAEFLHPNNPQSKEYNIKEGA